MIDPVTGALIVGGISSIVGGFLNYKGTKKTNDANRSIADKQMNFQKEQSDTAIQRQMKDMEAAGLNPLLAARYGGASTPGGAGYEQQNEFKGISEAVSSAIQLARMKFELKNLQEQNENMIATRDNLKAQNLQIASNVGMNAHSAALIDAQVAKTNQEAANLRLAGVHSAANIPVSRIKEMSANAASDILHDINVDPLNPRSNPGKMGKSLGAGIFRAQEYATDKVKQFHGFMSSNRNNVNRNMRR